MGVLDCADESAQVIISVMKWCWARLPGGVVTWEVYEGFRVGEKGITVPNPGSGTKLTAQTRHMRAMLSVLSCLLV
jgi:hypothetical protein